MDGRTTGPSVACPVDIPGDEDFDELEQLTRAFTPLAVTWLQDRAAAGVAIPASVSNDVANAMSIELLESLNCRTDNWVAQSAAKDAIEDSLDDPGLVVADQGASCPLAADRAEWDWATAVDETLPPYAAAYASEINPDRWPSTSLSLEEENAVWDAMGLELLTQMQCPDDFPSLKYGNRDAAATAIETAVNNIRWPLTTGDGSNADQTGGRGYWWNSSPDDHFSCWWSLRGGFNCGVHF